MMSRARFAGPILTSMIAIATLSTFAQTGSQSATPRNERTIVLWVRELHGQALYWVNHTPADRAPLSAIVAATQSTPHYSLTVIIDSRVPIQEMAEIDGLTAKLDAGQVHYYVYNPAYPNLGMSEIIWKTETVPLPQPPPSAGK